jgi:Lon protease-like protein
VNDETLDIPLFALDTVLFPGMELPLHIFEERYRRMVGVCLKGDRRFGVLLERPVAAGGGTAAAYSVGTSAIITRVDEQEDGGLDIQTAGVERFRVLHVLRTEPFSVGRVEPFPLEGAESPAVVPLVKRTAELFVRYLRLAAEALGTVIRIEDVPRDARSLAYVIGIALQVSLEEKQGLLSTLTLSMLLAREFAILSREEILLTRMQEMQTASTGYLQVATSYLSLN